MATAHTKYIAEVEAALRKSAKSVPREKLDYLQKYAGTQYQFLAITVPEQRSIFKAGYSFSELEHSRQFDIWESIWFNSDCHQVMSQALYWLTAQSTAKHAPRLWPRIKGWSERIENWAHSDTLCAIYAREHELAPERVYPTLKRWNAIKNNPWLRRISLVSLFEYASKRKRQPGFEKVIELVQPRLNDSDIFVQKAVGWTLRECYNAYPGRTLQFLQENIHALSGVAFSSATEKLPQKCRAQFVDSRKAQRARSRASQ